MSVIAITVAGKSFEIELESLGFQDQEFNVIVDGQSVPVRVPGARNSFEDIDWLIIDGCPYELSLDRDFRWIKSASGVFLIDVRDQGAMTARPRSGDGRIKAPIPGLITRIMVREGDDVQAGQPLLVLEAMKMENEIRAPHTGKVKTINVKSGQGVTLHEVLAEIN
jgi:acetyl/propionyl-CoA carboxylase alpha subunit